MKPILAMCNFIPGREDLGRFALEHGFSGVDWSLEIGEFPLKPADASKWAENMASLAPLEIRYHCPFSQVDIGHEDPVKARAAVNLFFRIIRLVAKAGGRYLTLHVGLGRNTTKVLSWQTTTDNLRELVNYGAERNVTVCLENLAWGWTSKPNLFEKLIRRTGAGVTLDIGHAHACESVRTQYYTFEDFLTPHSGRVFNAHVYHTEIPGKGHFAPERLEDVEARLRLLRNVGCNWWTLEMRDVDGLLKTRGIVGEFLEKEDDETKKNNFGVAGWVGRPVLQNTELQDPA